MYLKSPISDRIVCDDEFKLTREEKNVKMNKRKSDGGWKKKKTKGKFKSNITVHRKQICMIKIAIDTRFWNIQKQINRWLKPEDLFRPFEIVRSSWLSQITSFRNVSRRNGTEEHPSLHSRIMISNISIEIYHRQTCRLPFFTLFFCRHSIW